MIGTNVEAVLAPQELPSRDRSRVLRALLGDPLSLVGLALITVLIVAAAFGPWLAPFPEQGAGQTNIGEALLPPGGDHLLGTDRLGRDMLSRIILGARPAVLVSLLVVGLAVLIGAPLGAIAGYRGGRLDEALMRFTDLFLAFPPLLLAMAIIAALGPGLERAALALAISWWPWYARITRGVAASLRERPFVDAARSIGVPERTIVRRHILPNALSPILVQATVDVGTVILAAGSLAFIGLGARPPPLTGASWSARGAPSSSTSGGTPDSPVSPSFCRCSASTWWGTRFATSSTRGRYADDGRGIRHAPRN